MAVRFGLNKLKILLVHEVDYINKPFFEFQEFAEGLSLRGHDVTVLHVQEFERRRARKLDSIIHMVGLHTSEASIALYSTRFVVRGIFTRALAVLEHMLLLRQIFRRNRPDVVLSYSVPTSGLTVALFGKFFHVPVIHRAIDVSHLLRSKALAPFVRLSEVLTFAQSTSVSTHNSALQSYVKKTTGDNKRVSIEYPPVYPIDALEKPEPAESVKELRLVFIGTLGHFTDLEHVFTSMSPSARNWKINLRIVGSGPKENELKKISKTLGIDNRVEFRGWKQRKDLAEELSWANIGIVPFEKSLLTDCALPHKAIEYLSFGLPVVSTSLKGAESVLGKIDGMHFVESSEEIVEQCLNLARDQRLTSVDTDLVNELFSRDSAVENLEKMLIEVIRNKGK